MSATIALGEKLLFGSSGGAAKFLGRGWDEHASKEGHWSVEYAAEVLFQLSSPPQSELTLEIEILPYVLAPSLTSQSVEIYINGLWVAFLKARSAMTGTATIRPEMIRVRGANILSFVFPDATSALELGVGNDTRPFGFNFRSLRLSPRATMSQSPRTSQSSPKSAAKFGFR